MTADELDPMPPLIVEEALRRALAGDAHGGGLLLAPLVEGGRRSCYALAGMLAEAASHIARRDQEPDTTFGFLLENVETGEVGMPENLPSDVAFAVRFVTAWANRDQDTAQALFDALADYAEASEAGAEALIDGLIALFQLAAATAQALVDEQHTDPTRKDPS